MSRGDSRHSQRGFTLIELITVVVILGILLGVMVPLFRDSLAGTQTKSAAKDFAATIRYAQERAIVGGRAIRLYIETPAQGGDNFWLAREKETHDGFERDEGAKDVAYVLPEGVKFSRVTAARPRGEQGKRCISFDPSGKVDRATVEITGRSADVVTVETTTEVGRVEIREQ